MITYRCKTGAVESIDVFTEVRADISAGVREVHFLRMLGPVAGIEEKIESIDKNMGAEIQKGRLDYYRILSLPKLVMPEEVAGYSAIHDSFKNNPDSLAFKKWTVGSELRAVICKALENVVSVFSSTRASVTESIIKNFTVKILYWLDVIGADILTNWSENRSMKIIAGDIVKEQEYLFFYLLTQLGCDVLLLEFERDVEASDKIKQLSTVVSTNPFRKVAIPEYKKYVPVSVTGVSAERNELSYEQLAQRASSIVMIAVKDAEGEVDCTGSGIMVGTDGYILTNFHVVSGGYDYLIRIEDDDEIYYSDELIKYNQNLDLALIRINKRLNPLPVYRGPQKLVRGQKVVAIGSPLGMFNTVSDGIISGFRNIHGEDMIQFTAPISSGSSGGAVLNMYGEVIGISTAGIDGGQNLNLAMSYESILEFAGRFIQ